MLFNNVTKTFCGIVAVLAVMSCSISTDLDVAAEKELKTAVQMKELAKVPSSVENEDTIRVKDDIWLGDVSEIEYEGQPLPSFLETPEGITLISNRPVTLYELGDMINKITSIRVTYASTLQESLYKDAEANKPDAKNVDTDWTEPNKIILSYKGPLSGLLDEVGSRFGIWWKYEKNELYFYKQITRTFVLYSLPSKPSLSVDVGGSASGDSGDSSISLKSSIEVELWANIKETITSMIDKDSKLSVDSSNGTVTLTATPDEIKKVAAFINEQNARLSRQVAVSVKVLQVSISDTDSYGLDLSAAFNGSQHLKPIGTDPVFKALSPSSVISSDIANNLSMGVLSGDWSLSATVQALSTQGTTNLITSGTITTLNNKPAPLQVIKRQTYLSEITKTNSGGTGSYYDISTETEEIETGFTMDILPRILEHGRLLLMFNLTLSDLISLDKIIVGDSSSSNPQYIQNPVVEARGFTQEVALKSGESLVLTGYERVENSIDKAGIGSAETTLFGGSARAEKTRSILVIILTPVVLESPLSPESRMKNN